MTPSPGLALLVRLRLALVRNRLKSLEPAGWLKLLGLAGLTAAFLAAEGLLAARLLEAIHGQEDIAPLIARAIVARLLALVFLVSLSMLFFSNVTAALATIYLSRDLDLLLATPLPTARVFLLKLLETVLNSSYMVILFVTPILIACGAVFGAGPGFYLLIPLTLTLFVLPPAGAGILLTVVLMRYLPARRTHQALSTIGLLLLVSFVTGLRLLAPERLLRSASSEDLQAFLRALTVPAAEHLPSTWAAEMQFAALHGAWGEAAGRALPLALLALGSLAATYLVAQRLYFRGVSAAHEGGRRRRERPVRLDSPLGPAGKELRLFLRDPAQWSQLLLLVALVVIYVFNITALPRDLIVLGRPFVTVRDIIAWINVGLAGLVLAAVGMRFVLPSVSVEGGAFWVLAASPASRSAYLARKMLFYLPPLLLFALALVALSGEALQIDRHTRVLSLATTALVTTTLTVLALGLGAALPSFKLENPAQFVLTSGGVLYGVLSLVYVLAVVALEARPFFWHVLVTSGMLEEGARDPWPYYAAILALSAGGAGAAYAWGLFRLERLEL